MPVQMIELEEVTMVETTDESLEAAVGRGGQYTAGNTCSPNTVPCGGNFPSDCPY